MVGWPGLEGAHSEVGVRGGRESVQATEPRSACGDGRQRLLSQPVGGLSQHHTAPHTTGRLEE